MQSILRWAFVCLYMGSLAGAQNTVAVRIRVNPPSAEIAVDGQAIFGESTYHWILGSAHTLVAPAAQTLPGEFPFGDYVFSHWSTSLHESLSTSPTLQITVNEAVNLIQANYVRLSHGLRLSFHPCGNPSDPSPGTIRINGVAYTCNRDLSFPANTTVTVEAHANEGFAFDGWGTGGPVGGMAPKQTFVLNTPVALTPIFSPARTVTLRTEPAGLLVVADQKTVFTPVALQWGAGSTHNLAVVSPQEDGAGTFWVFDSWSTGKPAAHPFVVADQPWNQPVTARFVRGVKVSLAARPSFLKLEVDGSANWPGYSFIWGEGHTHTIAAPQVQYDADGRPWVFKEWTNGGARSQKLHVRSPMPAVIAAVYEPAGELQIETEPPGLPLEVDGAPCPHPCRVSRGIGQSAMVTALPHVFDTEMSRFEFERWTDGAGRQRTFTAEPGVRKWKVRYRKTYRMDASVVPPGSATLRFEPESPDRFFGWYDDIRVYVEPAPGWEFLRWDGDFAGRFHPAQLRMSEPRRLTAQLQRKGQEPSIRLFSAAGLLPESALAPDSLVSLFGSGLTGGDGAAGNPPSVLWRDKPLHLLYASDTQINALLPPDLPAGNQELTLRLGGQVRKLTMRVENGAPAVFTWQAGDAVMGLALDSTLNPVTPENPLHAGQSFWLAGTGFGPPVELPDGAVEFRTPLEVWVDGIHVPVLQARRLEGVPGIYLLQLRVPDTLKAAPLPRWRVRSAGRPGNTFVLPIE